MQNIQVSVIIPVYNSERTLRVCLESVLNQSLKNIEILCIDDGSTDDSLKILQEFASRDSRIMAIHKKNGGVSQARNLGISIAKGEDLCFVDSDDFIHPDLLLYTYSCAVKKTADIVLFGGKSVPAVNWIDQNLNVVNGIYTNPFDVIMNVAGATPFIWNKLFRSALLKDNNIKFDESLVLGEDQALLFDVFPLSKVVVGIDKKFYCYRQSACSTMAYFNQNIDYKLKQHFKIVNHIIENWKYKGYCNVYAKELAEWILKFLFKDLRACHFDFRRTAYKNLVNMILNLVEFDSLSQQYQDEITYMQSVINWNLTPEVSVIMPVYNAAEYLADTLKGLINQTFPFFEMIFVDDGSNDDSLNILKKFADEDSRASILMQNHLYAGTARNIAIRKARGSYLLFLDSDDFFAPKMIEKSLAKIKEIDADICVFLADQIDNSTHIKSNMNWTMKRNLCPKDKRFFSLKTNPKNIYAFTTAAPWNKLFKKNFIFRYELTFQTNRSANDVAFVYTALAIASKITFVDDVLLTYRVNNTKSLQGSQDRKPDAFYDALKELKKRLVNLGIYEQIEPAYLNFALDFIFYNLGTLKSPDTYRKIFNLIKNEILTTLGINDKTDVYFYAYQENHIVEKWHDISRLSSEDFAKKWHTSSAFPTSIVGKRNNLIESKIKVDTPKVSIIIPLLNSMDYLKECLDSVLQQTLPEIEVICVDAGSTDGTIRFIEEYAQSDKRIILLHSDKKSYGHQVNLGIQYAHGEFMAIVESDDYILPNMYTVLYGIAKRVQVDFVKCDFTRFYGEKESRTFAPAKVLNDTELYNTVGNPQKNLNWFKAYVLITPAIYSLQFIRAHHIQLNETAGASYQDNGFWFQVLMHAERVWFYPQSFYMLRRDNPNSSVKSKSKVYAMCIEYDFIYNLFAHDEALIRKYAPVCAKLRLANYNFTLDRIADEYKIDFLFKYADDFREILRRKELHGELYSDLEWKNLMAIIDNPLTFYFKKDEIERYKLFLLYPKSNKPVSLQKERTITWFPRKIRGIIRCFREHGMQYTLKRVIEHCGIDMKTGDFK